ncbi:phage major capsid protein [Propionibacterium freudenreichii]|uniref:phage major capsid protein n=1 Tax=Propionibacterium freudenreichii TaxID=1744 RepID=UPI00066099BA|nr:phage major capsid protein [Propionibacterium freudenreichii]MDK9655204.1 phage major capsid protein [Propionibacterium freudenreichii]
MTTPNTPQAWLPETIGELIVQPVQAASVAITALGSVFADAQTDQYRVPVVKTDPAAAWVPEGTEIPVSEQGLGEDADRFHKLAGLTIVSSELANDSNPDAAEQVGLGLARDIARKLDGAFFGSRGASENQPRGLGDITGVNAIATSTTAWQSLDPFTSATYAAENVGAQLAAFVANPDDALALAQLKDQTGSNRPLLGTDPTTATKRLIDGVPLLTSPAVAAGTVWGLPGLGQVLIAIRSDTSLVRDESVFFTSDRVAIRATMRVTTLFPHPAAIQRISLKAADKAS